MGFCVCGCDLPAPDVASVGRSRVDMDLGNPCCAPQKIGVGCSGSRWSANDEWRGIVTQFPDGHLYRDEWCVNMLLVWGQRLCKSTIIDEGTKAEDWVNVELKDMPGYIKKKNAGPNFEMRKR